MQHVFILKIAAQYIKYLNNGINRRENRGNKCESQ